MHFQTVLLERTRLWWHCVEKPNSFTGSVFAPWKSPLHSASTAAAAISPLAKKAPPRFAHVRRPGDAYSFAIALCGVKNRKDVHFTCLFSQLHCNRGVLSCESNIRGEGALLPMANAMLPLKVVEVFIAVDLKKATIRICTAPWSLAKSCLQDRSVFTCSLCSNKTI